MLKISLNLSELVTNQYWLGHDHTHTAMHAACALSGVHHVDIEEPDDDVMIPLDWVVKVTNITVRLAGRTL